MLQAKDREFDLCLLNGAFVTLNDSKGQCWTTQLIFKCLDPRRIITAAVAHSLNYILKIICARRQIWFKAWFLMKHSTILWELSTNNISSVLLHLRYCSHDICTL
jgi:hypothetical protein